MLRLLLPLLLACTTRTTPDAPDAPDAPPPPPPRDSGVDDVAACVLPVSRPADLTIGVTRSTISRGKAPRTARLLLAPACEGHPDQPCVATSAETLDRLYARLQAEGFAELGLHSSGRASPHYGHRSITLAWGDGQTCVVADGFGRTLAQEDRAVFRRLFQQITDAPRP